MVVGLTYDLRETARPWPGAPADHHAEFDSAETVEQIAAALVALGHRVVRVGNLEGLVRFLASGGRLDAVFNIAEGLHGRAREAQVPALLEGWAIPCTGADPLTLALSLDKAMTKRLWAAEGLPTAPFAVVSSLAEFDAAPPALGFPLFAKPVHEGSSKGIASGNVVMTQIEARRQVAGLLAAYGQPVLLEHLLPGREFTVGLLGEGGATCPLGVLEVSSTSAAGVSGFADKEDWEVLNPDYYRPLTGPLADALADLARRAYVAVGCRDMGRVDLRLDAEGQPQLLEINPLPALNRSHSAFTAMARQAGLGYEALIGRVLDGALKRGQPGLAGQGRRS